MEVRKRKTANPALNLAPFGRWTLRDKAAQRRLAPRYAAEPSRGAQVVRQLTVMLMFCASMVGSAFAERGDPLMSWPYFVQLDLNAYHGAMIEKCVEKHPDQAEAFRNAIEKWNEANMPAIVEIRGLIKARIRVAGALSETQAEAQMREASVAWTQIFLKMLASTTANDWKDACTGKYANDTLRALDFQNHRSSILTAVPNVPVRQLRP